jgi:hypothetical protein
VVPLDASVDKERQGAPPGSGDERESLRTHRLAVAELKFSEPEKPGGRSQVPAGKGGALLQGSIRDDELDTGGPTPTNASRYQPGIDSPPSRPRRHG